MATALPTGQRGQVLAAGLAVLAAVVFWLGVVSPLLGFYGDREDRLDAMQVRAAREAALIETLPALRRAAQSAARPPRRSSRIQKPPSSTPTSESRV